MKKVVLSVLSITSLFAGAYKIPETSLNSVALSAANVAHNKSADAAYYNPANMVFMQHDGIMEVDMMYIGLSEINYKGYYKNALIAPDSNVNTDSKSESFLIPSFHYVSPEIDGARFGLSMVVPAGLSKRWEEQPAKSIAEEFTLETIELNPTVALPIGDEIGISMGIRAIYSKGKVKSNNTSTLTYRDMDGDSLDFGYNLAIAYHPTKELEFAATYRSNVDLKLEGNAKLGHAGVLTYDGSASVEIPLPAQLNLAMAYTFATKTSIEFVYEKNYWNKYSELDFNYNSSINPTLNGIFGTPKPKNYTNTDTFRFGITQELDKLTLMAGLVIDETPIPDETLDYTLPDSDSVSVSFGTRYQITEKLNAGIAALYSMRDDRKVNSVDGSGDGFNGEFTDATVLLVSAGIEYKF